jgi:hypothetical protein
MRSLIVLAVLAVLLFAACGTRFPEAQRVAAGQEFVLSPTGRAVVAGLEVRFDEVVEDSRCPMNARCVWEGNARVAFRVRHADKVSTLTLNTSERFATRKEFGDTVLRLVRLEPTPMAGEKVKEYTVVLIAEATP